MSQQLAEKSSADQASILRDARTPHPGNVPEQNRDAQFLGSCVLPTAWGGFIAHAFSDPAGREHLLLTMGAVANGKPVLARIHSECLTGDALSSLRCDCGSQLHGALARIGEEGCGVLLYLRQEGRGIGLHNKIRAYGLQDRGWDTVDANVLLGFEADARDYAMCKPMLDHIGVRQLRLITNNPAKLAAMHELGIEVVERVAMPAGKNPHNEAYLGTKVRRMGHLLDE
ncbi:GTP cyclohydrolase II [Herbaspirillum sp. HC18]|nr:GTP cyclohydrolase II [Herbaspirillum sp. HC18]